jgi:hypothetical protein
MKYVACIFLMIATGCSKSTTQTDTGSIVGKWIETSYLADPGDGSGTWQPDNSGSNYFIFRKDSSADCSANTYFSKLESYHTYSDSTLVLVYSDGTTVHHLYKLDGNTLTIMGGCIETCGGIYSRAAGTY